MIEEDGGIEPTGINKDGFHEFSRCRNAAPWESVSRVLDICGFAGQEGKTKLGLAQAIA